MGYDPLLQRGDFPEREGIPLWCTVLPMSCGVPAVSLTLRSKWLRQRVTLSGNRAPQGNDTHIHPRPIHGKRFVDFRAWFGRVRAG